MSTPTTEAEIVFPIANAVHAQLIGYEIETYLTRDSATGGDGTYDIGRDFDRRRALVKRAARESKRPVGLFLSLHGNAATPPANGVECWYLDRNDRAVAIHLASAIQIYCGRQNRGAKLSGWDRIVKPDYYFFTTPAIHAVCLELAFVTNKDDCDSLIERIDDYAKAIAGAVFDMLGTGALVVVDAGHGSSVMDGGWDPGALAYNHGMVQEERGAEAYGAIVSGNVDEPYPGTPEREPWLEVQLAKEVEHVKSLTKALDLRQQRSNGFQHWMQALLTAYFESVSDKELAKRIEEILDRIEPRPDSIESFIEAGVERGSRQFMVDTYGEDWE